MRFPSLKTLRDSMPYHDCDHARMRAIAKMTRAQLIESSDAARARDASSYHQHKTNTLRMEALNDASGLHGVECICSHSGEYAEYLNTGDSYADTIIYWRGSYRCQSFGDFIETMERQSVYFD